MSIQQYKKYISTFGPDIMKEMTCDEFKTQIIKKPSWEITKVLLEQKIISGIGNYIKAEALYICGIAPHRRIHTLTNDELQKLFCCLQIICEESYHDRYEMVVYQKLYDPLGNPVITQTFSDQRTTYWVPLVQK
jgi:formamidopyrimidine-DNA glycosylase